MWIVILRTMINLLATCRMVVPCCNYNIYYLYGNYIYIYIIIRARIISFGKMWRGIIYLQNLFFSHKMASMSASFFAIFWNILTRSFADSVFYIHLHIININISDKIIYLIYEEIYNFFSVGMLEIFFRTVSSGT